MTDEEKRLVRGAQARDYYYNWGGKEKRKKYEREHSLELYEKRRRYYAEHAEKIKEYQKAYREVPEHREKNRLYQRAYRESKKFRKQLSGKECD